MIIPRKSLFLATALFALTIMAMSARAERVLLSCEHRSGAFEGRIDSLSIDFDTRNVSLFDFTVPAEITERFVTWRAPRGRLGENGQRIDRATGIMQYLAPSGWDTVFGNPGVVCRRGGVF